MMVALKGLATGIGSMPQQDPEAALDLIFKYTPRSPFWPQLPKRDLREGMLVQFSEQLPGLKIGRQGLVFDSQEQEKELEVFYERLIHRDLGYFKVSPDYALGLHRFYHRLEKMDLQSVEFIKGQVCGPFTFAGSINDVEGRALLHDKVFLQVILKGLAMKALWQIDFLRKFGKKIILFFDEPYLGCFGSAYTPINRDEVVTGLSSFTQDIKSEDVLLGVHCCGNTDWSIFTSVEGIDIISFDAFGFLDKLVLYAADLRNFFLRGGAVCWGIVPTQEFSGRETPDALIKRLKSGFSALSKKGLSEDLLARNLFLSPSCGLGSLDLGRAQGILQLLAAVAEKVGENTI